MTNLSLLPSATVLAGTQNIPAVAVPTGMVSVQFAVDRSLIDSATLDIDWTIEFSIDGGLNWMGWGGGGNHGSNAKASALDPALPACGQSHGLLVITEDATGQTHVAASEVPVGWSIVPGFEPTNPDRMLRGTLTINEMAVVAATMMVG